MLASRPSHHLDYLATSPSGADLGRLNDNPISIFCMHVVHLHVQPTPVDGGCIGVSWRSASGSIPRIHPAVGVLRGHPVESQRDEQPELHEQRLISGGDLCARFDWSGDGP